jgi:capsular exopolysaccharide synthesis family protein
VVTAVHRGEGATTVAAQFATALARAGRKVLLVDAHLAHPALSRSLGLDDGAGLAEVLAGVATETAAIRDLGPDRPAVLPAGGSPTEGERPPGDSAELFAAPKMRALLDTLCTAYDSVVIDAPPVLHGWDAGALGALGECLLVCRYGWTRRTRLAEAAGTLSWYGAPLLGVVLTRVPEWRAARGYRYRYAAEERSSASAPSPTAADES